MTKIRELIRKLREKFQMQARLLKLEALVGNTPENPTSFISQNSTLLKKQRGSVLSGKELEEFDGSVAFYIQKPNLSIECLELLLLHLYFERKVIGRWEESAELVARRILKECFLERASGGSAARATSVKTVIIVCKDMPEGKVANGMLAGVRVAT